MLPLLIALFAVLPAGCVSRPEWEFEVRNTTTEYWRIRVPMRDELGSAYVASVAPTADGVAAFWYGARENEIELLDSLCNVIGVFRSDDNVTYTVTAAPGVTGWISPAGTHSDKWTVPGIGVTYACGGTAA
jgi:hypothetical protein